jgi:hypothetical protein
MQEHVADVISIILCYQPFMRVTLLPKSDMRQWAVAAVINLQQNQC